jgi:F-type H+-transporting ATPase subunit b
MLYLAASTTPNPLLPDVTELIVGAICFFIIFGALSRLLLPRITKTLAERTEKIEGGLHHAEEMQAEANRLLEQYRAQLADARHEAARVREQAREEGARLKAELREQGEQERRRLVEAAQVQLEAERRQTLTALRAEVGALAVELASRLVGESLADVDRQHRVVDRFLDGMEHQAAGDGEATVRR